MTKEYKQLNNKDMERNERGTLYDRDRNTKDIAKLIRKDLKSVFNGYKFSIKTDTDVIKITLVEGIKTDERLLYNEIMAIADKYNYDNSNIDNDYFDCGFICIVNL